MSNHLAIATVTATLGQIVLAAAQQELPAATITNGRPENPPASAGPRIHVYLYQVTPNSALRNADLPLRSSDGRLMQRAQVALDLNYLLAFYGNDIEWEPQRMLGAVVRRLHAHPILSRSMIRGVNTGHSILGASDLADAPESVKFTPLPLSLEELSKLWSVFFQTQHALAIAYQASVVVIEAEESGPTALPVLSRSDEDRGVDALPDIQSSYPALNSIYIGLPEDVGKVPRPRSYPGAQLGAYLILLGSNFAGDTVQVEFKHAQFSEPGHPQFLAPIRLTVPQIDRTANEVRVAIPNDADAQTKSRAGPYTVSILITRDDRIQVTNALPLVLAPRITGIEPSNTISRDAAGNATLRITASPVVLAKQKATLLLADREIAAQPRTAATDPLQFDIEKAPVVTDAVVRLRVDGVDSIPFERTDTPPGFQFAASQKVTIT